jgi:rhamnosyltransferase subunit B
MRMEPKNIVLATLGSLGDLHPTQALALGLQSRGHRVTIATQEMYRAKVEAEGARFHAMRPNIAADNREAIKTIMDAKKGPEYLLKELIFPQVRASYEDLMDAVSGADLLVTHPITCAGPIVAEKTGIAWVSTVLAPISFFSSYDPPVLAPAPWLARLRPLGPGFHRALFALARRGVRPWSEPVRRLRAELGLPPGADPVFEGQHSPDLVLALFSKLLGARQPDWPPNTRVTGFLFYDRLEKGQGLAPELAQFLAAGAPPIVFTLGTSAVMDAGNFYVESVAAAKQLGRRAVLLVGLDLGNLPPGALPADVAAFDYAPFSELFPRAAAVVHQGGAGTTAQVLRAGRPMLVVPFAYDQPDNAARVERLGVARQVSRTKYSARRVASELRQLLEDGRYAAKADEIGRRIRSEDGVAAACDAIEERLLVREAPTRFRI